MKMKYMFSFILSCFFVGLLDPDLLVNALMLVGSGLYAYKNMCIYVCVLIYRCVKIPLHHYERAPNVCG